MTRTPRNIISDLRALADELEEILFARRTKPRVRRAMLERPVKELPQVTDLQRAHARRLLRERGLID